VLLYVFLFLHWLFLSLLNCPFVPVQGNKKEREAANQETKKSNSTNQGGKQITSEKYA
jgi:hypothetical protein